MRSGSSVACLIQFGSVFGFAISIPVYGTATFRRCPKVVDNTTNNMLAIFVRIQSCLFFYVEPVVTFFAIVIFIVFRDPLSRRIAGISGSFWIPNHFGTQLYSM